MLLVRDRRPITRQPFTWNLVRTQWWELLTTIRRSAETTGPNVVSTG